MSRKKTLPPMLRVALIGVPALILLVGCSRDTQAGRFGLPEAASDRAPATGDLWFWAWVACWVIGAFVWGLIGYAAIRFRRKRDDHSAPRQTRYNLPMEVMYTLVPILIVAILFVFTSRTETKVLAKEATPAHVIDVVGYKWSWIFNYKDSINGGQDVNEGGTLERIPDLYLPIDEPVRFNLSSPDVIHSFWVPEFYFKLDVIPGRDNSFDLTPTREGVFEGKCAELCGTYHSAMLFRVHVVPKAEYQQYLQQLEDRGQTGSNYGPQSGTTLASRAPIATEEGK